MMNLYEAYFKAKMAGEKRGLTLFSSCRDFGEFWGFHFWPAGHDPRSISGGFSYITVNKGSGELGEFAPIMDLDLCKKAKSIPVEQIAEYNVAV